MNTQYTVTENEIRTNYLTNTIPDEDLIDFIKNAFSNNKSVTLDNIEKHFYNLKTYATAYDKLNQSLAHSISSDASSFLNTQIIKDLDEDNEFDLIIKMNDKSNICINSKQITF